MLIFIIINKSSWLFHYDLLLCFSTLTFTYDSTCLWCRIFWTNHWARKNMHYKAACTISVTSQNNLPHFLNHKKRLYSRPSLEENFLFLINYGRFQSHTRKWAIYFCFSLVEKKQKQGTASKECKLIVWRKLWDELVDKAVFGGTFSSLHLFPWKNPDNSDFQASNTPFSLLY